MNDLAGFKLGMGFPGGASGKEPSCQSRRHDRQGFDPWGGKIPCRRAWQSTPEFLENPKDRGAWRAAVHGVAQSRPRLSDLSLTQVGHGLCSPKEMASRLSDAGGSSV